MDKVRICYAQTGRAVWMSHLDTMRTLQRAFNRADLPIRYSEGFNPHAQISILLPLSVGVASFCQMADIRLKEDTDLSALPGRLTAGLPEGFLVTEAYEGGDKPAEMKWLAVRGIWEYDRADTATVSRTIRELFSGAVDVNRRTKRGEDRFRLTDHITGLTIVPEERCVRLEVLLSCNEPVVNPALLAEAVREHCPGCIPDAIHFTRTALFRADKSVFR